MPELTFCNSLLREIKNRLENEGSTEANLQAILEQTLSCFGCVVGTIHSLDSTSELLKLRAQKGIPEAILNQVNVIPIGKGMAGLAVLRREPVQVCNLQTDNSGVAKSGAKDTKMEGSITVPMLFGETVRGALGVAKPELYKFSKEETDLLLQIASLIGKYL